MRKIYKIAVDCAACAGKMEEATKKVAGVEDATVNFMTQKMQVFYAEDADCDAVAKDILKACRRVEPECEIFF